MNPNPYQTVAAFVSAEIVIERSRFIGHCREVGAETEAKAFVAEIRAIHAQASHNCYAYRIGNETQPWEYYNDHGEPGGTAGKPILGAIQRLNLTNTAVVVTRYFGGKKLGVRGLIEAYGQAATLVLEKAGSVTRVPNFSVILTCAYSDHTLILHRLRQVTAEVVDSQFSDQIILTVVIPEEKRDDFHELLKNLNLISWRFLSRETHARE